MLRLIGIGDIPVIDDIPTLAEYGDGTFKLVNGVDVEPIGIGSQGELKSKLRHVSDVIYYRYNNGRLYPLHVNKINTKESLYTLRGNVEVGGTGSIAHLTPMHYVCNRDEYYASIGIDKILHELTVNHRNHTPHDLSSDSYLYRLNYDMSVDPDLTINSVSCSIYISKMSGRLIDISFSATKLSNEGNISNEDISLMGAPALFVFHAHTYFPFIYHTLGIR